MSEEFRLEMPQASAHATCVGAIESLKWKIGDNEPDRVVAKTGWGAFKNPGSIELLLVDAGGTATAVQMNGSIAQVGPIAKRNLRKSMEQLRAAIDSSAGG
jgi:hypothetical protein